ncbi:hypothetical protein ANN_03104 [Periplaneta americana]|uniref:Uncharacterized protein n=1 Tax=Periplaneta americana TaxID=6978 RepID=A0ABQ8U2Z8_PERAM|nr:hypothetical protein ANN_03104 [Periplaneta americana]
MEPDHTQPMLFSNSCIKRLVKECCPNAFLRIISVVKFGRLTALTAIPAIIFFGILKRTRLPSASSRSSGTQSPCCGSAVVILFCSCLILQVSNYAEAEIGGRHIRRITAADLPSSNITDATKVRLKKLQVRNGENCTTEPCSRSSTSAPPSSTVSSNKEETKKTVSFVADDVLQERLHSDVLSHLTTTSSPYAGGYSYFDDIVVSDRFGEETSHATKKSSAFNDDNYSGTEASNFGATLTTPRISLFDDIHARMTESIRQNLEEMDEHRFRDISRPHSDRSLEEQPSDTVAIHRSVSDVANEKTNESVALEFSSNLSIIYNNSASPSSVKKDLVVENGTHIELEKSLVHTKIEPEVNHTVYYISNDTHSTIIPNIESVLTKGAKDSRKETETLKSRPPVKISTTSESSINSIKHETVVTTERNDKSTSRDTPELSSSLSTASTNAIQNKTGTPGDKDSTTSEPTRGRSYSRSQKTINSLNKGDLKTSITKQSINDNSSFNSSESVSTKDPDSNAVAPVSTQNPRQANTNNRGSRMLVTRRGHYNTTNGQDQSSHSPISGSSENSFTSEDATKKPRVRYSTRRTGTSRSEEQIETSTVSFGTTTDYASAAKTEITEVPEDNAVLAQTIQNNTLVRNKNSNSEDVVTQTTGEPEESSTVEYTSSRGRAFSYRRPYTTDRSVTHDSEPSTGTDDSDETSTSRPSASSVNIEAVKRRLTTMRRRPQLTTETSVTINSTSNSTTESNVIVRGWPTIARRPSMEGKAPTNKTDNTDNNEGNDIISVRGNVYKSVTRNRGTVRYGSQRNDTSVLNQKNDTYSFPIPPTAAAWTLVTLKGPSNETRSVRHPVQGNNSTNSTKQTTAGRWPLIRNRRPWNTMKQESTTVSAESTRGSVSTSPKSTKLSAVPEEKQATRLRISRPQKKIQQPSMQENRMSTIQVLAPTTEQELEQTTENVLFSTTENDADIITTQSPQTTTSSDELTTSSDSSFESISATSIRNNINMMVTAINTSDMITSEINSNSFPSSASYVTSTLPTTSTDYAVTLTTEALESTTENPQWENTGTDNQTTESSSRVSVATEANISSSTNNAEDISTTTTENSSQGVTTLPGPFITAGSLSGFMEEEIINPPLRGEGDQQPENQEGDAGNNAESYQGIVNAEEVNNQGDESKQGVVNVEGSQQEESNRPPEETRGDGINSEGTHVQGEIPVGSSDEDENKNADGNRQLDESQNSGKQPPAPVGGDEPFPAQEEPADYGGPDSGTIDHNSDGVTAVPSRIQTDVPISNGTLISGTSQILDSLISSFTSDKDIARIKALQEKESGSWLHALPSSYVGTLMDGKSFQIATALRLGCKICHVHQCICGETVDSFGHHALSCARKSIEFETIATPRFEQTTTLSSSTSAIEWGADSTTLPSVSKVPFYLILTVIASWSSFCDRKDQFKQAVVDLMRNNQRSIATYQIMLPNADSNCPNNGVSRKTARSSSIEVEMYLVDGEINFDRQLTSDFYDYWRKSGLPGFPLEAKYAIGIIQDSKEGLELNGFGLHQLLVYADDVNMLAEHPQTIGENTGILLEASLDVNPEKTNCETWTLTLREEQWLRMFENKVLRKTFEAKRDEVTGEWRKLHNAELHALYSSSDIIRNTKSRRLRWEGRSRNGGQAEEEMGSTRDATHANRWTHILTIWDPKTGKRNAGRQETRWVDELRSRFGHLYGQVQRKTDNNGISSQSDLQPKHDRPIEFILLTPSFHRYCLQNRFIGTVCEWLYRFKSSNMSTEDMPCPGGPSSGRNDENIAKIKRAIDEDRRKTIDEVSEQTNLSWSTVQRILTQDLHMRRMPAKFVPRLLTDDQRENRVRVCRYLKSEVQNDPNFFKRIVTGDESWCYGYDPESKQASS